MSETNLGFVHIWAPSIAPTTAPTLLLLHGTGGDEEDLLPLGQLVATSANLLSPRGQVLENGMPRFFRRLSEGVFDIPDLRKRAGDLADFVSKSSVSYGFDAHGVTAVGFSNGANIAAALLLLHPGILKSAILLHPMVPLIPETLPDLTGVRVFIGAGRQDPIATPTETEGLTKLLQSTGAAVTLHWQPGGHGLSREEALAAAEWFKHS